MTNLKLNIVTPTEVSIREQEIYHKINPNGKEFDNDKDFPLNFKIGFHSITDFITYLNTESLVKIYDIIKHTNCSLFHNKKMYNLIDILSNNASYKEYIDFNSIIKYLFDNGFIRFPILEDRYNTAFVKFTEKNLPCQVVYLSKENTRACLTGLVIEDVYHEIKDLLKDSIVVKKEVTWINQLNGFSEEYGRKIGDYSRIELTDDMDYSLQEFYPWIKINLMEYFKEYMASRSNVLILIGSPGTGKSTMIRTIIRDLCLDAMVVYKPEVIHDTGFIQECQRFIQSSNFCNPRISDQVPLSKSSAVVLSTKHLGSDNNNFIAPTQASDQETVTNKQKVVVIEDADIIMGRRVDGNVKMSEILNATSGICSDTHSKFIMSTNLKSVDDIDPALMRPGRCFDILCFRELTATEACVVRKVRGLKEVVYDSNRKYKLSEVLNETAVQNLVEPIVRPRFGFV